MRSLLPLFVDTEMVSRDGRQATSVGAAGRAAHGRRRRGRGVEGRARGAAGSSPARTAPVGRQTRLMAAASAVTPDWANRLVVSRLAR